jgi:hypothetical protein
MGPRAASLGRPNDGCSLERKREHPPKPFYSSDGPRSAGARASSPRIRFYLKTRIGCGRLGRPLGLRLVEAPRRLAPPRLPCYAWGNAGELAMIIRCILFVDGKPQDCILGAVPRVGELILTRNSEVVVENIKHIARGALEENPGPHVQIFAKVVPAVRRIDDAPRPQEARSAPPT